MSTLLERATPRTVNGKALLAKFGPPTFQLTLDALTARNLVLAIEAEAVNAYEPLVKALRELLSLSYHYSGCESSYRVTTRCGCGHQEAREKAFAALAIVTESDSGTLVESSPEREGGE